MPTDADTPLDDAQLAQNGTGEQQYQRGRACAVGLDGPRDLAKAAYWYELAARQQHPQALHRLGCMHFYGAHFAIDPVRGRALLEQAAALGYTESMVSLGDWHLSNAFGAPDRETAMAWYRKAADAGDADGQFNVGLMHEEAGDFTEAAKWYRMALDYSSEATCALAGLLADGKGVAQDIEEACKLYDWAGDELQFPLGYYGYARLHDDPKYGRQDLAEAAGFYFMAADKGVAEAQLRYAELAELGFGDPDNANDPYVWTRVALEHLPPGEMARGQATLARIKTSMSPEQLAEAEAEALSAIKFLRPYGRC
jgi:uncharacterized protein